MTASSTTSFANLHVHTEYSLLDGMASDDMFAYLASIGQDTIAVTDHGTLAGLWKLSEAGRKHGIKVLAGLETYVAVGSRFDRDAIEIPADDSSADEGDGKAGAAEMPGVVGTLTLDQLTETERARAFESVDLIETLLASSDGDITIELPSEYAELGDVSEAFRKLVAERESDPSDTSSAHPVTLDDALVALASLRATFLAPPRKMKKRFHEHLTLIATNERGWSNLLALSNAAELSKFQNKPRIDLDLLAEHHEGLIILTGCLGGAFLGSLSRGDRALASDTLRRLVEIAGTDRVFVEVMEHGIDAESRVLPEAAALATEHGVRLVATNDAHYVRPEGSIAHAAWLAHQSKSTLANPKYAFHGAGYHLASEQEMRAKRPEQWWQDAVTTAGEIAALASGDVLPKSEIRLPKFPLPDGETDTTAYFVRLINEGATRIYGPDRPAEVSTRLQEEFAVVAQMGMTDYFLIVADMMDWARSQGILCGPGRGSAAGSLISYCLGIVTIDPLEHNLLFERFLEPGRKGMPDIDSDFEAARRDEVFAYLGRKYGNEYVARIGTFGFARTKKAIKDAARVLELTRVGDTLAKEVPIDGGKPLTFEKLRDPARADAESFRSAVATGGDDAVRVVELAEAFEDLVSTLGVHACGFLVSDTPVAELVPVRVNEDGLRYTAWDGRDVEALGLCKIDILGLANLDGLAKAFEYLREFEGIELTHDQIPHPNTQGDPRVDATYRLLREGKTSGVFQLESDGITALTEDIKPENWDDLSAILALYRPGPMGVGMHKHYGARKHGLEAIDYGYLTDDPEEARWIDGVLGSTHGLFCLAEGQEVYSGTRQSWVPIEELLVGELVQGVDESTGEHVLEPVEALTKTGINRDTVTLTLQDGSSLRLTTDHPVLTARGWVEVGDIEPADSIATPWRLLGSGPETAATEAEMAEALVVGYLLADGALGQKTSIVFSSSNAELRTAFDEALALALPGFSTVAVAESRGGVLHNQVRRVGGSRLGGRAGTPADDALRWARELGLKHENYHLGGPTSPHKRVPAKFFRAPLAVVRQLLASLWDCDGSIQSTPRYSTVSAQLADDVVTLLSRVGITTTTTRVPYSNPDGGARVHHTMCVNDIEAFDREIAPHMANSVRRQAIEVARLSRPNERRLRGSRFPREVVRSLFTDRGSWTRATNALGYTAPAASRYVGADTLSAFAEFDPSGRLQRATGSRWSRVASVTPADPIDVWDITVHRIHNFVARGSGGGMVVHNCFQEQIMSLGRVVAGFDAAARSKLRKAIGKKIASEMDAIGLSWVQRATQEYRDAAGEIISPAFSVATAERLWEAIKVNASYAFNASHSYAYARTTFDTAYVKANWPAAYGAALLATVSDTDRRVRIMQGITGDGVEVLPPDVNRSGAVTQPEGAAVRLGLAEIKDAGEDAHGLIRARDAHGGAFPDLPSIYRAIDPTANRATLGKRMLEALVEAGAMDEYGPRLGINVVSRALATAAIPVPDLEWSTLERAMRQRARIGTSFGTHPLVLHQDEVRAWVPEGTMNPEQFRASLLPVHALPDVNGARISTLALLASAGTRAYRGGKLAQLSLEGSTARINGVMWNDRLAEHLESPQGLPPAGALVLARGKVSIREVEIEDRESGEVSTTIQRELTVSYLEEIRVADDGRYSLPDVPAARILFPSTEDPELLADAAAAETQAEADEEARLQQLHAAQAELAAREAELAEHAPVPLVDVRTGAAVPVVSVNANLSSAMVRLRLRNAGFAIDHDLAAQIAAGEVQISELQGFPIRDDRTGDVVAYVVASPEEPDPDDSPDASASATAPADPAAHSGVDPVDSTLLEGAPA